MCIHETQAAAFPGAICPVTLSAVQATRVYCFSVAQFEAMAGPVKDVFSQALVGRASVLKPQNALDIAALAQPPQVRETASKRAFLVNRTQVYMPFLSAGLECNSLLALGMHGFL